MTIYSPEFTRCYLEPRKEQIQRGFHEEAHKLRMSLVERFQDRRISMVSSYDLASVAASVKTGFVLFDPFDGDDYVEQTILRLNRNLSLQNKPLLSSVAKKDYRSLFGPDDDFYGKGTLANAMGIVCSENNPSTMERMGKIVARQWLLYPNIIPLPSYDISTTEPVISLTSHEKKELALPGVPKSVIEIDPSIGTISTFMSATKRNENVIVDTDDFYAALNSEAGNVLNLPSSTLAFVNSTKPLAVDLANSGARNCDLLMVTIHPAISNKEFEDIVIIARRQLLAPKGATFAYRTTPDRVTALYNIASRQFGEATDYFVPRIGEQRMSAFVFGI